jgi:4-hydroxybenzoate polyprenyltransferase
MMAEPRSQGLDILTAARPRQWIKNLLVYAGLLFTLGHEPFLPAFLRATVGVALFCFLSSAAYMVNDALDVQQDRLHTTKRHRPLASGRLSASTAWAAAAILAPAGLAGAFAAGTSFGVIALAYFAITLAYSAVLKHVILLDVMALALGYVLRAVAGAAILDVPASFWLALCTLLLALFLGLCKRRGEITTPSGTGTRVVLEDYTVPLLDQMISVVTSSALLAYALYTYFTPTSPALAGRWRFRDHLLTFTIPFVVYGIYRYLYLVYRRNAGDAPEDVFLKDRPLQANTMLWVLACVGAMLLGGALGR